jgi:hypothetical protein
MIEIPSDLLAAIPPEAMSVARRWWDSLSEAERGHVAGLWDDRREVHFFAPQADEAGRVDDWEQVPRVAGGRFLPPDDAWGLDDWGPGYFEHLLQHPELMLLWEPAERTFHIGCTRHAAARAALEEGAVPADFACPLHSSACPLRTLRGAHLIAPAAKVAYRGDSQTLPRSHQRSQPEGFE